MPWFLRGPIGKGFQREEAFRRRHEASGTQFDSEGIQRFVPIAQWEMPPVLEAVGVTESSAF